MQTQCGEKKGDYTCRNTRVQILVEVDLDPVMGWGHEVQDYVDWIQHDLTSRIPHYHPKVTVFGQ